MKKIMSICHTIFPAGNWKIDGEEIINSEGIVLHYEDCSEGYVVTALHRRATDEGVDELMGATLLSSRNEIIFFLEYAYKIYNEEATLIGEMIDAYDVKLDTKSEVDEWLPFLIDRSAFDLNYTQYSSYRSSTQFSASVIF